MEPLEDAKIIKQTTGNSPALSVNSHLRAESVGEIRASETLVFHYYPDVLRLAASLIRNFIEAEDIPQETFITGRKVRLELNLEGSRGKILDIAFSINNQYLASTSTDQTIYIWRILDVTVDQGFEPPTRRALLGPLSLTLTDHEMLFTSVEFSPAGNILASASADDTGRGNGRAYSHPQNRGSWA